MGRIKKYRNVKALERAVEGYFASITRTVAATERVDTGRKDGDGHKIYAEKEILNDAGEKITYTEYVLPPTVGDLCTHLGIHRSTWADYCDAELHPEFANVTSAARNRMRAWNERELLTRKDVKGIIFNLQNNYDYRERREVELGPKAARTMAAGAMSVSEKAALLERLRRETLEDGHGQDGGDGA